MLKKEKKVLVGNVKYIFVLDEFLEEEVILVGFIESK